MEPGFPCCLSTLLFRFCQSFANRMVLDRDNVGTANLSRLNQVDQICLRQIWITHLNFSEAFNSRWTGSYNKCIVFQVQGLLCFCSMVYLLMAATGSQTWITIALALCWQTLAMMYGWETAEGTPGPGSIYTSQWSRTNSGFSGILIFVEKLDVLFASRLLFLSLPIIWAQSRCECMWYGYMYCLICRGSKREFYISMVSWDSFHRWSVEQ